MGKKVFIATDESGLCFIMSEKPVFKDGKFISSGGLTADFHPTVAALLGIPFPAPGKMIEWPMPAQTAAPEPEPPEMEKTCCTCKWDYDVCPLGPEKVAHCFPCDDFANWEQREEAAETSKTEPEPPAETLVPITTSLKVGDVLRSEKKCFPDLCVTAFGVTVFGELTVYAADIDGAERIEDYWTIHQLIACGYQQVIPAPRPLSRSEAREAIINGQVVKNIETSHEYKKSGDCLWSGDERVGYLAVMRRFDIPEGRYGIVS